MINFKKIITSSLIALVLFIPAISFAQYTTVDIDPSSIEGQDISALTGLGDRNPIDTTVLIVNWILSILGLIFLVLVVYAGFSWMTSAGEEETITKAKKTITAAIMGLLITLASYGISNYIFSVLADISKV